MERYDIAVLPGDGIGPEIMAHALRVLRILELRHGFALDPREGRIGQAALSAGDRALPPDTLRMCKDADAVLMGPVGGSEQDDALSTHHPKQAVIGLRAWLGSFATLRLLRGTDGLDLAIVYDNSSGLFYGSPRGFEQRDQGRVAFNTQIYSDAEAERTMRLAFEVSLRRGHHVHAVDQARYLETGQVWRDAAKRVEDMYPEVTLTAQDASHFFYDFALDPGRYDVIVSEMTLGHLIASAAAGFTGSLDIHAAAYLGGDVGVFQPSHGAMPELAGQGTANPLGMLRAASLMLGVGLGLKDAAHDLDEAIEQVVATRLTEHEPPEDTMSLANAVIEALPRRSAARTPRGPEAHDLVGGSRGPDGRSRA